MTIKVDPRIQAFVRVGEAVTKVAAQVAPQPLQPLFQAGASGFETARKVLVNLDGGAPPPSALLGLFQLGGTGAGGMNYLRVTSSEGLFFRSRPTTEGNPIRGWGRGTEFERVTPQPADAVNGWVYVRDPTGQEGYIYAQGTTEPSNGLREGTPYVQPQEGVHPPRNGTPEAAVAWAKSWEGLDESDGFANFCLKFVMEAYGVYDLASRCPELSNPAATVTVDELLARAGEIQGTDNPIVYRETVEDPDGTKREVVSQGTAFGAFLALEEAGKIQQVPEPPARMPEGAIIFFAPTAENKGAGHVAIVTYINDEPYVVTSGFESSNPNASPDLDEVRVIPLADMEEDTGGILGYADPNPNSNDPEHDVIRRTSLPRSVLED